MGIKPKRNPFYCNACRGWWLRDFNGSVQAKASESGYFQCANLPVIYEKTRFFSTLRDTVSASFLDMKEISSAIRTKGLSSQVYDLLTSENYHTRLNQCFGDDPISKNLYITSLIAQDLGARVAGIVLVGGIIYYGGALAKIISVKYPVLDMTLKAAGIVLVDKIMVKILEEYILSPNPEANEALKKIMLVNENNMKELNNYFQNVAKAEFEKIESLLAGSVYNLNLETSKLVIKRQKLLAAIMLTQDTK